MVGAVPKGFDQRLFVGSLASLQVNVGFALNGRLKLMGELHLARVGLKEKVERTQ